MKVQIHRLNEVGQDVVVGALILDEEGLRAEPVGLMVLRTILREPVRDQETGLDVWAQDAPERFLKNLRFTYKSAYLRAGEVED